MTQNDAQAETNDAAASSSSSSSTSAAASSSSSTTKEETTTVKEETKPTTPAKPAKEFSDADVISSDKNVVKVSYKYSIAVWSSYNGTRHVTGQYLKNNSRWSTSKAVLYEGNIWYNLGGNQWVSSEYVIAEKSPYGSNSEVDTTKNAVALTDKAAQINYGKNYSIIEWTSPNAGRDTVAKYLKHGAVVNVKARTAGSDGKTWFQLEDGNWISSRYAYLQAKPAEKPVEKPTEEPTTLTNTSGVISYVSGYGVALWQGPGTEFGTVKGKILKNGSAYKVFKKAPDKNGTTWYNLGGNQWVSSKYLVIAAVPKTAIEMSVPWVSQKDKKGTYEYGVNAPWGCASAALGMILGYDGHKVDRAWLKSAQDGLPRYSKSNPNGQQGDPYTGAGFGWVINSTGLTNYDHKWDNNVVDVSGASIATLKSLVLSGHPVLYYGWSSYQNLDADKNRNHCKVIVGFKDGKFKVQDPLYDPRFAGAGDGGMHEGVHNFGYDNGKEYWSSIEKLAAEYNGHALTLQSVK